MRLMLVGTDRALFNDGSAIRARFRRFAPHVEGLDSIVFSSRQHGIAPGAYEIAQNMHAHPTNSRSRLLYPFDALRLAKTLPRPDIVSAQDPFETGLAAWLIARHFGVPFALEMHTDFLAPSFRAESLLNRVRLLLARFLIPRAAGGYAVSERLRNRVLARYRPRGQFAVLPIYIDLAPFKAAGRARHPRFGATLLFVGRLEREKRPLWALDALEAAREAGEDARLVFAGSGSLESALRAEVNARALTPYVEFAGHVSDIRPFYAMADLMLVTSLYEGYGMALVEALAAGVPVLATDVGVAREVGAVVTDAATPEAYAEALCAWLAGARERGRLRLTSYASEDEYFARVVELYSALAATREAVSRL